MRLKKVETNGSVAVHLSTMARVMRGGFESKKSAQPMIAASIGICPE